MVKNAKHCEILRVAENVGNIVCFANISAQTKGQNRGFFSKDAL
jgi:hypothetical protein